MNDKMEEYNIIIRNGKVVDGTGAPWSKLDVGIRGEKIAKVRFSIPERAPTEIDATGLMVAPGFWDLHSHDDFVLPVKAHPDMLEGKIRQGITTHVVGNCGYSPHPFLPEFADLMKSYVAFLDAGLTWGWTNLAEFIRFMEKQGIITNVACNVGQGAIRINVMGFATEAPTEKQMDKMKLLIEEEMKQGAFGMTTGLLYPPGMFTSTEELIELTRVVAKYGGYYGTHRRGSTATFIQSTWEAIKTAQEAKCPGHIHHLEAYGPETFWKIDTGIRMIEEARDIAGIDVTYDMFPYSGANTTIMAIFPPWALEGGVPKLVERLKDLKLREKMLHDAETYVPSWFDVWGHNLLRVTPYDWILIIWCASKKNKRFEGKTLAELGEIKGKHPFFAAADLTVEENGAVMCIYFGCSATKEEDWRGEGIIKLLKHPYAAPETDAIMGKTKQHPAGWGLAPRVIGRYARDMRLFTIEEAVRKLTSLPAHRINCQDRGIIREGSYADITIFNPKTIIDTATYYEAKPPLGIEYVLVNGKVVLEKGEYHKDVLGGKVLRGPAYVGE